MKENAKEGRIYALFGKTFLLFAAALVMLCIHPLTAHAEGQSGYDWQLDPYGNLTIVSDDGMEDWTVEVSGGGAKEKVTTVTVSEGVTMIDSDVTYDNNRAFYGCPLLTTVSLPSTLEMIEDNAFRNCIRLTSVTMNGETPPEIGDEVFLDTALSSDKDSANKIYVPETSIAAYKASWPQWADYIYDGGGGDEEDPEKPDPEKPDPDDPENPNPDDPEDPEDPGRNPDIDPTADDYVDTSIEVLGFTANGTVYSVDVEWGAMTFWYENTTWDATAHKTVPGAGWKVYDSEKNKALDTKTDAINRIQVTNHSNEDVWATLAYTGESKYADDTLGSFDTDENDADTVYDKTGKWLSLGTADNGVGDAAGTPTVGTVYFMPKGIKEEYKTDGIAKWSQLGTITVGILTEEPKN